MDPPSVIRYSQSAMELRHQRIILLCDDEMNNNEPRVHSLPPHTPGTSGPTIAVPAPGFGNLPWPHALLRKITSLYHAFRERELIVHELPHM